MRLLPLLHIICHVMSNYVFEHTKKNIEIVLLF